MPGTIIDTTFCMADDLKSQIAISKPPFRAEDISPRIHIIRGHRRDETASLRSQIVTLKKPGRGMHWKYSPFAFTEQGVAMLSGVLNSPRAVQVNIAIMRAFVRMRQMLVSHEELARKVDALEKQYDAQFRVVFDAIRALMEPAKKPSRQIGF